MTKQRIKRIIDFIAFSSVVLVTVLVLIGKLIPSFASVMFYASGAVAFLNVILSGGYYAFARRNGVYITLYFVAIISLIVILIVFRGWYGIF